jgi:hypothetical protein
LASAPAQKYDDKRAEQPIARRKSTLDPHHRPDHNQARAIAID